MSFVVEREIAEVQDWYQVHHLVEGYKKMLKILRDDIHMDETYEVYFEQNVDSGYFRTEVMSFKELGGRGVSAAASNTTLVFDIVVWSKDNPTETEDGMFGRIEFNPIAKLAVEMPGDPEKRSHQFLRKIWHDLFFEEQFERWVETAEERLTTFTNEMRNFYGLEPAPSRTERLHYEPVVRGYH